VKNKVHLIAYVDRFAGGSLQDLQTLLEGKIKDVFAGVHILPFFHPIDGSDAGFDPIDHTAVDKRIGSWDDVFALSQVVDIMADVIVNHISAKSPQFLDFLKNGEFSAYSDLFLTYEKVYPNGATEKDHLELYRPRPGLPFTVLPLKDGSKRIFWTTFTPNQIDIDVLSAAGKRYLLSILERFKESGIKMIRLDAAGYAIKVPGTSSFMIPQTFEFIEWFTDQAHGHGMEVLVEVHSYYKRQIEIAEKVDWVYDFALPPLVLDAIYRQTPEYLGKWLEIRPHNSVTVLDTHDGIGVIDVGGTQNEPGFLPNKYLDQLVETMHARNNHESRKSTGSSASNLDLYQVNCTYYDALGRDDDLYLLSRAIQFFCPGVPQVYYMGFLAEPNDMHLLEKSNVGRDINRHYFKHTELEKAFERPVVEQLIKLINLRNNHPAFNGTFSHHIEERVMQMVWRLGENQILLQVNFRSLQWHIEDNAGPIAPLSGKDSRI
jgi:sucrose phosphorylase